MFLAHCGHQVIAVAAALLAMFLCIKNNLFPKRKRKDKP